MFLKKFNLLVVEYTILVLKVLLAHTFLQKSGAQNVEIASSYSLYRNEIQSNLETEEMTFLPK